MTALYSDVSNLITKCPENISVAMREISAV